MPDLEARVPPKPWPRIAPGPMRFLAIAPREDVPVDFPSATGAVEDEPMDGA
jgi:hypothetical protein